MLFFCLLRSLLRRETVQYMSSAGAGTGTVIMKALMDEGYEVTAGVLNMLDTDYETAELLKIPNDKRSSFFADY